MTPSCGSEKKRKRRLRSSPGAGEKTKDDVGFLLPALPGLSDLFYQELFALLGGCVWEGETSKEGLLDCKQNSEFSENFYKPPARMWKSNVQYLRYHIGSTLRSVCKCWKKMADSSATIWSAIVLSPFRLSDVRFSKICQAHGPVIKNLDLSGLGLSLSADGLVTAVKACSQLTKLNLSRQDQLKDAHMHEIIKSFPQLRSLDVGFCIQLSDKTMRIISSTLCSLTSLNLENCLGFDEKSVAVYLPKCTALTSLNCSYCHDLRSFDLVAEKCSSLIHFNISGTKTSDAQCVKIASALGDRLKIFSMSHKSNTALLALAKKCPNMEHLDITYCSTVTDSAIFTVADKMSKLVSLNLCACFELTDKSVDRILTRCTSLKAVNINRCKGLSVGAVGMLKHRFKVIG
jgi:hypothetical protein